MTSKDADKLVDRLLNQASKLPIDNLLRYICTLMLYAACEANSTEPTKALDALHRAARKTFDDMQSGKLPGILQVEEPASLH